MSIKKFFPPFCVVLASITLSISGWTQVNTGSDGHNGTLNPTTDLVIDMVDQADGIYQYTSVNIPAGVRVTFVPNARNAPVVWLCKEIA